MSASISRTRQGLYRTRRAVSRDEFLGFAHGLVAECFTRGDTMASPEATKRLLVVEFAREEREVFAVIFLDSQHRIIALERLFLGTIDAASVHPREVAKRCLQLNAAAVILSHNHPSGVPEPSAADRQITANLVKSLDLVGVRVLDHFVIGGTAAVSFAERGWI